VAIVDLSRAAAEALADAQEVDVRLEVHDASRLEWSVAVPLPADKPEKYAIELELEIPINVFAHHTPWDQLQSWTRLDGPAERIRPGDAVTIDELRRGAVAFAGRLARSSEGFSRHCRLAGALFAPGPATELEDGLDLWLGAAIATVEEARDEMIMPHPRDGQDLLRERGLVNEYISLRFLELMAGAERALASLAPSRYASSYAAAIERCEARLAQELEKELAYRETKGFVRADPGSHSSLEQYLERASRLKKHFQEVLFLEPETFKVADRIHHWVAGLVALLASTWAFAWQIILINKSPTTESRIGSGIFVFAVLAGLVYASKDRLKEIGRTWISGHVHRLYAQRVARWRAPSGRLPERPIVVNARESFDQKVVTRPDPLNPECGARVPITVVRFSHRGEVQPNVTLVEGGIRRVKHIFRYDLSPLFTRLDDAMKQVPVLDAATRRVRFTDAPRRYRVPVRLKVSAPGASRDQEGVLVLHKRGLDRLEMSETSLGA
jgi:hypothetical protein